MSIADKIKAESNGTSTLSVFEQRFIDEYLKDLNNARAWLRAGGGGAREHAGVRATQIKARPHVKAALDAAIKERRANDKLEASVLLAEVLAIATADPNEIVEIRRGNCRHCHGTDHRYQYVDERELAKARNAFELSDEGLVETFTHGGIGFDQKLSPVHDCPHCGGDGGAYVHVHDTRNLSPAARALFAGAKQTKDGIEVKLHDKSKHIELGMRHLGLLNDKLDVNVNNLGERILAARKRARGS